MKEMLEQLGFTAYESEIYLCLLENGPLSAYDVSERTGLYRQACYDALNRMLEKSTVTQLKEGKRRLFSAANPELLLEQLREKESALMTALPHLLARKRGAQRKVEVEVFQGKNVLNIAATDVIKTLKRTGGENCSTAADEQLFFKLFGASGRRTMEYYEREMGKHKFTERLIIKEGVKGVLPGSITKYRAVPAKFFNPNPVQVYGDTVQIFLLGQPSSLIIIRSEDMADSFRKQFELMWKVAKPIK